MAETGIDYEAKAYAALQIGDAVAAQAWATLHHARMTKELTAKAEEILREWKRRAPGSVP